MALATDYDGTIAHDGIVPDGTIGALRKLKQSGRRLILVTGRELPDLERVIPHLDIFDLVVAENGALLHSPATRQSRPLGPPPPGAFVERLRAENVSPLSVGEVIVATWEPNETIVLRAIRDLGLDLQIIFNKGAVMVLPNGVNKASGLHAALEDLGLSAHNVVSVGDAENDLAFMRLCGCAVAVGNALPAVKDAADLTTEAVRGEGVSELIERLIAAEAAVLDAAIERHSIELGTDDAGQVARLRPGAGNILVAGTSGGGRSTVANALLERIAEQAFQFFVFDPEGDYASIEGTVCFGDAKTVPRVDPVLDALRGTTTSVVVNMLGLDVADRPALFSKLYPAVLAHRKETGRPHWLLVHEAHHMGPEVRGVDETKIAAGEPPTLFLTVHPDALPRDVLNHLGAVVCIGATAAETMRGVVALLGRSATDVPDRPLERGEALFWDVAGAQPVRFLKLTPPKQAQKRHTRKYAEGALG